MKRIMVTFRKGQATIETFGFQGEACLEATKKLAARLGITTSDTPKDEMYATPDATEDVQA